MMIQRAIKLAMKFVRYAEMLEENAGLRRRGETRRGIEQFQKIRGEPLARLELSDGLPSIAMLSK